MQEETLKNKTIKGVGWSDFYFPLSDFSVNGRSKYFSKR